MEDMIKINGAYGESGGQILRTAVALSVITQKPLRVVNIRKGRKKPGLAPQHLCGVKAAAELCNAKLTGATLHSTEITFSPRKIKGGEYEFNVGTAGAITLVLQALVPISVFADGAVELSLIGGTDVKWSPTISFFLHVLSPALRKMGLKIKTDVLRHGFWPKGSGRVTVKIKPAKPRAIQLTKQGKFEKIDLHAIASESLRGASVCERMISGFKANCPIKNVGASKKYVKTLSPGANLHAHAHYSNCTLAATVIGERGTPAEKVGKRCAKMLDKEMASGATVDHRTADQLMIFMALASGDSKVKTSRISNHIKTNKYVIEKFLPAKFTIKGKRMMCVVNK